MNADPPAHRRPKASRLRRRAVAPAGSERRVAGVPTWEELAESHGRFVYTVAYRLTGQHDDAQDLVQEVFVRVQRGLRTYQPGSLEGWLSRITTNAFLDGTRAKKRRPTDPLPDEPDRVLAGSSGPDEEAAQHNLPDHLQSLLADLPEDYRAAVVLCDVIGMSYSEIAEALDTPVGTVRSRIHRGRSRLRKAFTEAGFDR